MADQKAIADALHEKKIAFSQSPEFDRLTPEQRLDRWDQIAVALHDEMIPLTFASRPQPPTTNE
jgi:hypothetical protein